MTNPSGSVDSGTTRPTQSTLVLSAVGYLPLLFPVPLLAAGKDPFSRFHGRQSLVLQVGLMAFWVAIWIADFLLSRVLGNMLILGFVFKAAAWLLHYPLGFAVSLSYVVLAIAAMVQSLAGQQWRIPVVGAFAERLGA